MVEWVALESGAEAAVATPERAARGAVVVAGELFGITDYLVAVLERLAEAGYVAVAPDFYWRSGRRIALGYDDAGRVRGFELLGALDDESVVADVAAARDLAREHADGVSMLGFSVGGHFGVLAATRLPFDVVVTCYGGWTLQGPAPLREPHPPLDDAEAIAGFGTELLGVVGEDDQVVPQDEWRRIGERLTAAGVTHELVTYPGLPHGFLCPDRPSTYDAEATEDTWRRVFDGLERRAARR